MKIIDLLNKIANGEEVKAKLKFKLGDVIITYYGNDNYYKIPEYKIEYVDKGCTTHEFTFGTIIKCLNDEVEIIEENNIIDEFEDWLGKQRIRNSEWDNFVIKDARLGIPITYLLDKLKELKENNKNV